MRRGGWLVAILVSVVLLSHPASAATASPSETLQRHVTAVLALLRDPVLARPEAALQRRLAVRQVVDGVIDFPAMAKQALGRHWSGRTAEERAEFVRVFSDLLETIYVSEIERNSEQVVSYVNESVKGADAMVETRVRGKSETRIDYRMHVRSDQWRVYDVEIGGLSIVENFRSQLHRMLRDHSYATLIEKLREAAGGQAAARPM